MYTSRRLRRNWTTTLHGDRRCEQPCRGGGAAGDAVGRQRPRRRRGAARRERGVGLPAARADRVQEARGRPAAAPITGVGNENA
eukprot:gene12664-biopygen40